VSSSTGSPSSSDSHPPQREAQPEEGPGTDPLITIDVIKGRSEAELRTLLDTVHAAMVEAFGVPESDRYQILTEHEPHQLVARDTGLGLTRTEDLVILRFISRARPEAAKQRLYQLLATGLESACGLSPNDLIVSITENGAADWSFGGGVAQFLTGALPEPD
jgi:phenylpyruvate tautomerase PptA (4-oxalocrotonate tautomerase family)